jgi:hypothetical protein
VDAESRAVRFVGAVRYTLMDVIAMALENVHDFVTGNAEK